MTDAPVHDGDRCAVGDVLLNKELIRRTSRPADYEAEAHALGALARERPAGSRSDKVTSES